jgi:PhnB protein
MAKPIPDGYHTLTPNLRVRGGEQAIEFYKKAFDAELLGKMPGPDGKSVMHAELKIGDSRFMLGDEMKDAGYASPQTLGGTGTTIHIYVKDADAAFKKALAAGAKVRMPLSDMFWGDRYGVVTDPYGHEWSIATHKEDLTPQEIQKRCMEFMKNMQSKK